VSFWVAGGEQQDYSTPEMSHTRRRGAEQPGEDVNPETPKDAAKRGAHTLIRRELSQIQKEESTVSRPETKKSEKGKARRFSERCPGATVKAEEGGMKPTNECTKNPSEKERLVKEKERCNCTKKRSGRATYHVGKPRAWGGAETLMPGALETGILREGGGKSCPRSSSTTNA